MIPPSAVLRLQRAAGNRAVTRMLARSAIPDAVLLTRAEMLRRLARIEAGAADPPRLSDTTLAGLAGQLQRLYASPHLAELSEAERGRMWAMVVVLRTDAARRGRTFAQTVAAGRVTSVSAGGGSGHALTRAELREYANPTAVMGQLREVAGFGPLASLSFSLAIFAGNDVGRALEAGRAGGAGDTALAAMGARIVAEPQARASATDPEPTSAAWSARPAPGPAPPPPIPYPPVPSPPAGPVPIPYPNAATFQPIPFAPPAQGPTSRGHEAGAVREVQPPTRELRSL